MIGLYDREGHLSPLGLHQVALGEADAHDHLATCAACQSRLEGLRLAAAAPLPALRLRGEVVALPRRRLWVAAGSALAMAAALLLWVGGPAPGDGTEPDTFTARGTDLRLEVYRDAPGGAERLAEGSLVAPGDRLGFRFASRSSGHLVVLGIDEAGSVYPVWPAEGSGTVPVEPAPEGRQLDAAVALDDTPGDERLICLRCDGPLAWPDIVAASGRRIPGCAQAELRLRKDGR